MQTSSDVVVESVRAARLIAYFSVCMLIAALGAMLGPDWWRWWVIFGTFGLVSAVGLDVVGKLRLRSILQEREKQVKQWGEQKLDRLISPIRSTEAIRAAVSHILTNADLAEPELDRRREETRFPLHKEVTISPICELSGRTDESFGDSFVGFVRDISPRGIGLAHDRPLDRGSVLLRLDLENGEQFHFLADLLWYEQQDDGRYHSGGKLIELVNSNDTRVSNVGCVCDLIRPTPSLRDTRD